jgi:L-alanine-DL-glutamate epimerase-like enolase superfamily enzyme
MPDDIESRAPARRRFLRSLAGWTAATAFGAGVAKPFPKIKITEIETHRITVEYEDWIAYQLNHFYGPSRRTVYVVHTDAGLEGLGEGGSSEPEDVVKRYIGTSPFDWVGDETSLPLAMAMYDLMGKAAGVPVYKLFGQKYRSWVPMASWTVSTHPRRMAQAVREYSKRGFTWLKFHLSPFENIFDQMAAMQAVAPEGFKVHLDFTMGGTNDHMPELLERLSAYRIAGCFEDVLREDDLSGWIELRKRSRLPIVYHHTPLGAGQEVVLHAADVYMLGHARIGTVIQRAGLFSSANIPFMLQNVGGDITRAMTAHMQAAFQTADFHFVCSAETCKTDVVRQRLEPVNGVVRVPEAPGLGVTLDRAALERAAKLRLPEQPRWIVRSRFKNGSVMHNIADPAQSLFMVRPDIRRLLPLSYTSPVSTDYWDDDGTPEYKNMFARIEREGVVLEPGR